MERLFARPFVQTGPQKFASGRAWTMTGAGREPRRPSNAPDPPIATAHASPPHGGGAGGLAGPADGPGRAGAGARPLARLELPAPRFPPLTQAVVRGENP